MGGNQSQDEVFLAAQEAVGAHRDSQGKIFVLFFIALALFSERPVPNFTLLNFPTKELLFIACSFHWRLLSIHDQYDQVLYLVVLGNRGV